MAYVSTDYAEAQAQLEQAGSRMLVFAVPGGLAGFFRELGAGLAAGGADRDVRAALSGKYDSHPENP